MLTYHRVRIHPIVALDHHRFGLVGLAGAVQIYLPQAIIAGAPVRTYIHKPVGVQAVAGPRYLTYPTDGLEASQVFATLDDIRFVDPLPGRLLAKQHGAVGLSLGREAQQRDGHERGLELIGPHIDGGLLNADIAPQISAGTIHGRIRGIAAGING